MIQKVLNRTNKNIKLLNFKPPSRRQASVAVISLVKVEVLNFQFVR